MDTGLSGQVVLITGGAGLIGRTCGRAFAREGAIVLLADLSRDQAEHAAASLRDEGGDASGVALDVTGPASVTSAIDRIVAEHARIDVLLHAHGIFSATPFDDLSLTEWRGMLDVNLTGIFLCCKAVVPVMRRQGSGRIISIASLAGQVGGLAASPSYAVSKAGVACLTKSIARAVAGTTITVNTINPGPVESAMADAFAPGLKEAITRNVPLGRLGQPADVAGMALFLASNAASYIHGAHLDVNGGLYMD